MNLVPLHYLNHRVGHAVVPDGLQSLPPSIRWGLSIPDTNRALVSNRTDVILASLLDDTSFIQKCTPFTQLRCGKSVCNLNLVRVVLRPVLVTELIRFVLDPSEDQVDLIRLLSQDCGRVIYLDHNRLNLTRENLREIPRSYKEDAVSSDDASFRSIFP